MHATARDDAWDSGEAYERYVGRWSRRVAARFLDALGVPALAAWADVGCGTGALTAAILADAHPLSVAGVDASETFVGQARRRIVDPRACFDVGDATRLPWPGATFDAAVSGLVLNFVPEPAAMVGEMRRVTKPGGTVALYVWDYADGMQMLRAFWDAAVAVDPGARALDEAARFPVCRADALRALFEQAGLAQVQTPAIDVDTAFADFDDYWTPFLAKTGPAPAYLASLDEATRGRIRERLHAALPRGDGGAIALRARAWSVRGTVA
jgi:SAM-dependent methyltransferase